MMVRIIDSVSITCLQYSVRLRHSGSIIAALVFIKISASFVYNILLITNQSILVKFSIDAELKIYNARVQELPAGGA